VRCEDEDVDDDYTTRDDEPGNELNNGGSLLTAIDATSSLFEDLLVAELFPDCRLVELSLGPAAGCGCPFWPIPGP
jgi:hypothetical protein